MKVFVLMVRGCVEGLFSDGAMAHEAAETLRRADRLINAMAGTYTYADIYVDERVLLNEKLLPFQPVTGFTTALRDPEVQPVYDPSNPFYKPVSAEVEIAYGIRKDGYPQKIEAIKAYRERTGCCLADSKRAIESIEGYKVWYENRMKEIIEERGYAKGH